VVHGEYVAVVVAAVVEAFRFRAAEVGLNVGNVDLGVETVASVVVAGLVFDVAANVIEVGVDREAMAATVLPLLLASPPWLAPTTPVPLLLTPQPPTAPSATRPAAVPMPHFRSRAVRMMPNPPRTAGPSSK
jgi:hypothetical protein